MTGIFLTNIFNKFAIDFFGYDTFSIETGIPITNAN